MAKRKSEDEAKPSEAAGEVAEAPEAHDPAVTIGIDSAPDGTYEYVTAPEGWNRDRSVNLGGRTYEHCAVDADGCWLFRRVQG